MDGDEEQYRVDFGRLFDRGRELDREGAPVRPPRSPQEPLPGSQAGPPAPETVAVPPPGVSPFDRRQNAARLKATLEAFVPPEWAQISLEEVRGVVGYVARATLIADPAVPAVRLEVPVVPDFQGELPPTRDVADALVSTCEHLLKPPPDE